MTTASQSLRHGVPRPVNRGRRGIMALVPDLNRRAVLRMGAGASAAAAGAWGLSALLDPLEPQAAPPQAPAPFEPKAGSSLPGKLSGSFISAARGGVPTNWVVALPPGQTP